MLQRLHIRNYAIIDRLSIEFSPQLNIITGETGAGKSILLGAMGLILGQRSNPAAINDRSKKCVVEGYFDIEAYDLGDFFSEHDLDHEPTTIIRREITPAGKSRAFVNDTPVSLAVLKKLTEQLVNLLAQHQTLYLNDRQFQLTVVDALAGQLEAVETYRSGFRRYQTQRTALTEFVNSQKQQAAELDYLRFQIEEIDAAKIEDIDEQRQIDEELNELNNVDTIKTTLGEALHHLQTSDDNIIDRLNAMSRDLERLGSLNRNYQKIAERVESAHIELQDVAEEISLLDDRIEHDPQRAAFLQERLDLFNRLQNKHNVQSLAELKAIFDELRQRKEAIDNADDTASEMRDKLEKLRKRLEKQAAAISKKRQQIIPTIEKKVRQTLARVGMENARLRVWHQAGSELQADGFDDIEWQFSANKGSQFVALKKVASGGELSRLMLSIQTILADSVALPTLIFDEIDTGISGEIAKKVGRALKQLAQSHQLICITHLPQIASCATHHLYVYKSETTDEKTASHVKLLDETEHIHEIGQMIDGKPPGETALRAARTLVSEMEDA